MTDENGKPLFRDRSGKPTTETRGLKLATRGDGDLYLSPPVSPRRPRSSSRRRVTHDRTNGGQGYTETELNHQEVYSPIYHRNIRFETWPDRLTYLADLSNRLTTESELRPFLEPTRHSSIYIDGCLQRIEAYQDDILAYQSHLKQHISSLEEEIAAHVWVLPGFAGPAAETLQKTSDEVRELLRRIRTIQKGFELLPRQEDDLPGTAKPKSTRKK
jgi:hypothetical protein